MLRLPAAVAALILISAPAALAQPTDSTVTLTFETGARSGRVMVALYDSEAAYSSGRPVAQAAIDASGPVVAVFDGLPAGE